MKTSRTLDAILSPLFLGAVLLLAMFGERYIPKLGAILYFVFSILCVVFGLSGLRASHMLLKLLAGMSILVILFIWIALLTHSNM
jgi:hypothetical protein